MTDHKTLNGLYEPSDYRPTDSLNRDMAATPGESRILRDKRRRVTQQYRTPLGVRQTTGQS